MMSSMCVCVCVSLIFHIYDNHKDESSTKSLGRYNAIKIKSANRFLFFLLLFFCKCLFSILLFNIWLILK